MNSISFFKAILMRELNEKDLPGNQEKIAQAAEPKDKITAADFAALRAKKGMKKEDSQLEEKVDMDELEFELNRLKKENPGKKITYDFIQDSPKGYVFYIDGKLMKENASALQSKLPGVKLIPQSIDPSDYEGEYDSIESYSIDVPGLTGGYGDDAIYLNLYNGNAFAFFHDGSPIATSKHSAGDRARIARTQTEVPLPIELLNTDIYKQVLNSIRSQFGTEEEAINEGEDHEVSMAHNSLESIIKSAMELKMKLGDNEKDIPAWIQDHITNAENYINQASKNYHEYGEHDMDELPDGTEELPAGDEEDAEMSLQALMEALAEAKKKKPSAGLTKKQKSTIAKKAASGKDIGKKGKGFEKIAKAAAKKYGSKERGQAVAAAAMWKSAAKKAK